MAHLLSVLVLVAIANCFYWFVVRSPPTLALCCRPRILMFIFNSSKSALVLCPGRSGCTRSLWRYCWWPPSFTALSITTRHPLGTLKRILNRLCKRLPWTSAKTEVSQSCPLFVDPPPPLPSEDPVPSAIRHTWPASVGPIASHRLSDVSGSANATRTGRAFCLGAADCRLQPTGFKVQLQDRPGPVRRSAPACRGCEVGVLPCLKGTGTARLGVWHHPPPPLSLLSASCSFFSSYPW